MMVTGEARRIADEFELDFMLIQEPYSSGGKVKGFDMAASYKIVRNRSDDNRPMEAIVCRHSPRCHTTLRL